MKIPEELFLFVEKAQRLETSAFWDWATSRRGESDMEKIVQGNWLAHDGLNQDALDAFCLNLRFLIQDRDGFSIRKIADITGTWEDRFSPQRKAIREARDKLHQELKGKAFVQFKDNGEMTNEELFQIVFYGGIVHANPKKRKDFTTLTTAGAFSYFVFQSFLEVLFFYRNCIQTIAFHISKYIKAHESSAARS